MFESDDWTLEDDFNDIDEKAIQPHSRCQNDESISSVKRRKVQYDGYSASSSTKNNAYNLKLNTVVNKDNDPPRSSKNDVSRENLLLGIFQESTCQKISNFAKEKDVSYISKDICHPQSVKKDISNLPQHKEKKSESKVGFSKKTKLVRIFPGPAGLISPLKNNGTSVTSCLDNAEESEDKTEAECIDTNFPKSQDEKIFDEKAWEFLLRDLPSNFFKEYGISVIKSRANASHCDNMRVKFIAGTLDHIDHSHEDPFIILKDSTGNIEGTIHRDISSSYPGVLEPNVVILLHDVGLLKTTKTYIMMNKYHILISRVNLLAIYSNKGRIVQTSSMGDILSSISNVELTKDRCVAPTSKRSTVSGNFNERKSPSDNRDNAVLWTSPISASIDDSRCTSIKNPLSHRPDDERESREQTFRKDSGNCKTTDKVSLEHSSMDIDDDMSDVFFTIESDFDHVPDEQRRPSSGIIAQISEVRQRCESQTRNSCRENTRKESVLVNLENKLKDNLSRSTVGTNDARSKRNDKTGAIQWVQCSRENSHPSNDDTAHKTFRDSNTNSNLESASPMSKCNAENSRNLASYFTGKTHRDNDYDSDDEILSQLDVDISVFNNRKNEC